MITSFISRISNRVSNSLRNLHFKSQITRKVVVARKLSELPDYPSSDSTPDQFFELTMKGAQRNYSLLHSFSQSEKVDVTSLNTWPITPEQNLTSEKLRELFNRNGSDKGDSHGYHHVYATLIDFTQNTKLQILEIGLGTNNRDTPSNMGRFGIPGASLRSWRDLDSRIEVVGADIDSRVLFQEERISTYQVYQTEQSSWDGFTAILGEQYFDLIIDDGLHAPLANLMTIKNLLPRLKSSGHLVIEDVNINALPLWDIFSDITKNNINIKIVKASKAHMVILSKGVIL